MIKVVHFQSDALEETMDLMFYLVSATNHENAK